VASKYVGGVVYVRDYAGSTRASFTPGGTGRQREALKLVTDGLFQPDSFRFKPEFLSRVAADPFEVGVGQRGNFSLAERVLKVQTGRAGPPHERRHGGAAPRLVVEDRRHEEGAVGWRISTTRCKPRSGATSRARATSAHAPQPAARAREAQWQATLTRAERQLAGGCARAAT
jgi:hypothetical protein